MKLTDYQETRLPIYDIDLEEPAELRWKYFAQKESANTNKLLNDVVKLCNERFDSFPAVFRPFVIATGTGAAMIGGRLIGLVASYFGEEYITEIKSIAKYADVPLSHVILGNLMYDGCQMAGIYGVGCSSFSCNIDGKPTLVRNMDWVWPRSTGRHTRLVRFHRGKKNYMSVGILGCVGVASAFCPGKWAITMNQAPTEGTKTGLFQWPVLQRLRHVCDRLGAFSSVVNGVREYQTMSSFFAHIVGSKPSEHAVVTGLGDTFRRRGMKGRSLWQTNHFLGHNELEEFNGPERWKDEEGYEWYCDSFHRAKCLARRLKTPPKTLAEARKKICSPEVTTRDTMQQMVFQPASDYAKISIMR